MKEIKGKRTEKNLKLYKNKPYVITAEEIIELAKSQEGNKILTAINGLARIIKEERETGELEI